MCYRYNRREMHESKRRFHLLGVPLGKRSAGRTASLRRRILAGPRWHGPGFRPHANAACSLARLAASRKNAGHTSKRRPRLLANKLPRRRRALRPERLRMIPSARPSRFCRWLRRSGPKCAASARLKSRSPSLLGITWPVVATSRHANSCRWPAPFLTTASSHFHWPIRLAYGHARKEIQNIATVRTITPVHGAIHGADFRRL